MSNYAQGEAVQVLHNVDNTEIWFNARIKSILKDKIQVYYLDQLPNYGKRLAYIQNSKLNEKVRPYQRPSTPRSPVNNANKYSDSDNNTSRKDSESDKSHEAETGPVTTSDDAKGNDDVGNDAANDYTATTSVTPLVDPEEHDINMADKSGADGGNASKPSYQLNTNQSNVNQSSGTILNPLNWPTKIKQGVNYFAGTDNKPKKKRIRTWDQKSITNWTNKDVISWIESLAPFKKYASTIPNYIDGQELLKLQIDDLALFIPKNLWRKKFMKQIVLAKEKYAVATKLDANEYESDDVKENYNSRQAGSGSLSGRGGGNHGQVAVNGVVGLRNLGNTCYMNTSIQILSQTPLITRYLAARAKINNNGSNNYKYPMLNAWTLLCDTIYNQKKPRYGYKTESPGKIRKALGIDDKEFVAGTQDDSSRSLGYMLDALDEQIEQEIKTQKYQNQRGYHQEIKAKDSIKVLRELSGIEVENAVQQLLADHNPNGSILRKAFDGVEQSTFECLECNKVFQQYDTFRIAHLPVISNEITFTNVNVVCNNNYYKIPEITVLDNCSVNLLQHHVIKYLLNEKNEQIVNYDIDTVIISQNKMRNVNNIKLSELQNMSGCIFVLVNENKMLHSQNKTSALLQLNVTIGRSGSKIKANSASYSKYYPNGVHKVAINEIERQQQQSNNNNNNDDDDEKYDYFVVYNGNVFSAKELEQKNFKQNMHNYGNVNLMVIFRVNQKNKDYCYDISNMDRTLVFEVKRRYRGSSILQALKKERSFCDSNKNEISRMNDCDDIEDDIDAKLIKISESMHIFETKKKIENDISNYIFNKFKCNVSSCRKLTNLEDCLREYEKEKIYDDTSYAYPCPHCKSGSNSKFVKITKKIVYSPPILLIHLDRYGKNIKRNYQTRNYQTRNTASRGYRCNGYGSNKFDHGINYNMKLIWPKLSSNTYNLYGISNHSGSTDGGHYTATIKCLTDGNWYDISDSYVNDNYIRPLSKAADATILAYARNV